MIIRSKAPLRLGLAGGGTDVSPYSDLYGGAILNATISLYAYTTIEPLDNGQIIFSSPDAGLEEVYDAAEVLDTNGYFVLAKGVYNRIVMNIINKNIKINLLNFILIKLYLFNA